MTAPAIAPRAPRLFVFCRFYLIDDFRANLAPVVDRYDIHYLTDGHSPGEPDTRDRFYTAFRAGERCSEISAEEEEDIILRCRVLRNIDRAQAVGQLHAMALAITSQLDIIAPDGVLSHLVDDYTTHLFALLAQKRGLPYCGFAYSLFPGKCQLTADAYGTPFDMRIPSSEEVGQVLDAMLERAFRQNYGHSARYGFVQHAKLTLRNWTKRVAFYLKGRIERDPLNLHYMITPFLADRTSLLDFPAKRLFDQHWQQLATHDRLGRNTKSILYIPLAYFPEATIDYWIRNLAILDYEARMIEVCRALSVTNTVLVKEHFHMAGIRKAKFYAELRAIDGVILVPPEALSNEVLEESDAVIVGGGSVGVEATIRDKPVFSFCPTAYWFAPSNAIALDLDRIEHWPGLIRAKLGSPQQAIDREAFVKACLASTARVSRAGSRWPIIDPRDLTALLEQLTGTTRVLAA